MAKINNLPASAYAKPHTMSGAPVVASTNPGSPPNRSKADTVNMSIGNISKAARELGLTRTALYRRLNKYDI